MNHQIIAVLDYGSQYTQLICRRVREQQVYAEVIPWERAEAVLSTLKPAGIILSGGPNSVYDRNAPTLPNAVIEAGVPVLGVCYGLHLMAYKLGGVVVPGNEREYGRATLTIDSDSDSPLFVGLARNTQVWMSHGDRVEQIPTGFHPIAHSDNSPLCAFADESRQLYAIQFHPEVAHTLEGGKILHNFVRGICGCTGDWTSGHFIDDAIERIRTQVGETGHVICGLSGGVDSAVAATLVHKAIGDRLTCVFVDHGLLRLNERQQVIETFRQHMGMKLVAVDAIEEFLADLAGVSDPEQKRKLIGTRFVRVFESEAARLAEEWDSSPASNIADKPDQPTPPPAFLAQGTLYPDVIESASSEGEKHARTIKTHHNVGGLPKDMTFQLIEPLRMLFKDEVRRAGEQMGLPADIVWRHPFPGPGLAIRVIGEVTWERLETLRAADAIFLDELRKADLYRATSQVFAVLLPVRSVGVMGDGRTYGNVVALRAVTTDDFMTADWAHLPYDLLARVSNRIVNEVSGVNRVVYDISSKPPATIEWE